MKYNVAIQFYGHLRTFQTTFKYFKKNVIQANPEINFDIFIHTWNKIDHDQPRDWYEKPEKKPLDVTRNDINFIQENYNPVNIEISPQRIFDNLERSIISKYGCSEEQYIKDYNLSYSLMRVNKLRRATSKDYMLIITTRLDILFLKPFRITELLKGHKYQPFLKFSSDILKKSVFYPYMKVHNFARNQRIYITGINLLFVAAPNVMDKCCEWHNEYLDRPANFPYDDELRITEKIVKYGFYPQIMYYEQPDDFIIFRKNMELPKSKEDKDKLIKTLVHQKQVLKNNLILLKQNLIDTETKNIGLLKSRIQNHLSYKLGSALITNSKSLLGYIKMPYMLMAITIAHKEQNKNLKLAKNKLPPLESYADYKEALKEKECFTYKLGQAFIKAHKNWYGGGYMKFILKDVPRLKREFKEKRR